MQTTQSIRNEPAGCQAMKRLQNFTGRQHPLLFAVFERNIIIIMCNMLNANQTNWETKVPVCDEMSNRTSAAGNCTRSFTIIVK